MKNSNLEIRICDQCGNQMHKEITSKTFKFGNKEIELKGIETYVCDNCDCDNEIYVGNEIQMIEKLIIATMEQPKIDILNLEETADLLRVSNQTVYNMIKAGRIKAHKIGREWKFMRTDIMAYLESGASDASFSVAAKGGKIDKDDLDLIESEVEKRRQK